MTKEVSDKVVVTLLILAVVFSIGGTLVIYDSVNDYKEGMSQVGTTSGATGMVTLEVAGDPSNMGGNEVENFE